MPKRYPCRKLKLERIDGVGRPTRPSALTSRGTGASLFRDKCVRPFAGDSQPCWVCGRDTQPFRSGCYTDLIMGHGRRQILWLGVTAHPTAEWIANQITQACGWDWTPVI